MNRRWSNPTACAVSAALALGLALSAGCKNGQRMSAGTLMTGDPAARAPAAQVAVAVNGGRSLSFKVEIARSAAEREQGLMYRDRLAPDAGMLFIFDRPSPLTFWMKNTVIPLDMIFIDGDRRILGIVENAEPLTLSARRVDGLAQYVLEINGGLSTKLGIHAGAVTTFSGVPDKDN